ncbi:ATP-dependent RNA helicase mtr4, partial [Kappamyces sp. JEL0680]
MHTNDLFEVFSDDDEQDLPQMLSSEILGSQLGSTAAVAASALRKRKDTAMADNKLGKVLKSDAGLSGKSMEVLVAPPTTTVTDDFEQSVDKEYASAKTTLLAENAGDESLVVKHQVRHQVALPPNHNYTPIAKHVPLENPARTWSFTLDPFQRTAINSIERNESVLVSAHTSAGKTVVAEYAIAQSIRAGQRVIYTSPIKKYRDLLAEFGDVGLMTGDVTINPSATCLVMTTEILRSMLYRGSEVMREVAWVVFDEIHYMRDAVRGVVWEETLILLPDKVRLPHSPQVHFVFLSATIPNAMQFAEWICKIKHQPCHVVYTDYRPTPLQHYLFPEHGDGIHLVVDEKSNFKEDNFQKAIGSLADHDNAPKSKGGKGKKDRSTKGAATALTLGASDLFKIVKMINLKNYHPVIVFSFSKKECENNALQLSKIDFNTDDEKALVKSIYTNAIQSLGEDDRTLPQIEHLLPLLQRGIGIHHSGLLPILKEVIEIMFQEGLIKVLFATETFSIGLNMPAKTVVFTSVRKFDGKEQRWLSGGEYIQMSGRAGRRGLDDRGIVILMIDQKMEPAVAKGMLKGVSDALNSAFHLTYTMILNLSRVDGVTHEYMLQNSFHQHQHSAKIPELLRDISILEQRLDAIDIEEEELVQEYYQICTQLDVFKKDVRKVISSPTYCLPFLQPGRLVKIEKPSARDPAKQLQFGWGVIVNFNKVFSKNKSGELGPVQEGPSFVVDVLLHCAAGSGEKDAEAAPCPDGEDGELVLMACSLDAIEQLSSVRLRIPNEIKTKESRNQILRNLKEVKIRFKSLPPLLDPVKDMQIKDASFVKLQTKIAVLEERKQTSRLRSNPNLEELYALYDAKMQNALKIKEKKKEMAQAESVLQMDELK